MRWRLRRSGCSNPSAVFTPARTHFIAYVCFDAMLGDLFQRVTHLLRSKLQFVIFLQVHPDIRSGPEPLPKTQRRIACDSTFAGDDLRKSVCRHSEFFRKFICAHAERLQFVGQVFPWMD